MIVVNTNQTWQPHKGRQKTLQNLTENVIPRAVFKRHSESTKASTEAVPFQKVLDPSLN